MRQTHSQSAVKKRLSRSLFPLAKKGCTTLRCIGVRAEFGGRRTDGLPGSSRCSGSDASGRVSWRVSSTKSAASRTRSSTRCVNQPPLGYARLTAPFSRSIAPIGSCLVFCRLGGAFRTRARPGRRRRLMQAHKTTDPVTRGAPERARCRGRGRGIFRPARKKRGEAPCS